MRLAYPLRDIDTMPLFGGDPSRCGRCGDLGLWLTPQGKIEVCPVIQTGRPHNEPNAESKMVERAGRLLAFHGTVANPIAFSVARALTRFSTDRPASRDMLINKYFDWAASQSLRKFHAVIEELRTVWLLPVASRKQAPHGYWIATTQQDFDAWFQRAAAAPKTQLQTIFRLAKANWPVYGEQIELDFWRDMGPDAQALRPAA